MKVLLASVVLFAGAAGYLGTKGADLGRKDDRPKATASEAVSLLARKGSGGLDGAAAGSVTVFGVAGATNVDPIVFLQVTMPDPATGWPIVVTKHARLSECVTPLECGIATSAGLLVTTRATFASTASTLTADDITLTTE